ncbi:MAG: DNA translocase FtsK, partial [Chloroflexota bacterium]|nr:DNA translocase FtsK [Chloroflexota bacterium]
MPSLSIADRRHRELAGVALLLVTALSAWSLVSGQGAGLIPAWWARVLTAAYGTAGSWVIPLLLGLAAIRFLRPVPGPVLVARHYAGGLFLTVSSVGLLRLGDEGVGTGLGGNAGAAVATMASEGLGEAPAAVFLLILGWVAVLLLSNTSFQALAVDVRGAWVRGRAAVRSRRPVPSPPEPPPAPVVDPPSRRRIRARNAPVEDAEEVVATVPVAQEAPVARTAAPPALVERVINIPKREPPVTALPDADLAKPGRRPQRSVPLPLPSTGLLAQYDGVAPDTAGLETKARLIEESLRSFRVEARVREINPGPSVTQFALEPGGGVKVRRITELQNDLALALAAPSIRIEAPIPGFARVGLEIPNEEISTVGLRETLESAAFARGKQKLPIPLGRDVNGRYVVHDLTRMPHLLIAGATGSGKSVCLNGIISTFLLCRPPEELKILMIDPKMVELTLYNGVPHLQCPVVTEMDKVVGALRLVLREMERRYAIFSRLGVRNLDGYRLKTEDESDAERLPYLVVIIDELADLMMTAPIEVEALLVRLAQMARATGIHLILATQRPSVNVLTGLIKANVPARIAFAVSSGVDSRVVLDMPGAERLLGRGDMLFLPPDAAKPQRVQGAYIEDGDVQKIVAHWHAVAPVPSYAQEWME